MLHFSIENARAEREKNLGCEAGCRLTVSWSDHSRIMVGSAQHCAGRFSCFRETS